MKKTLIIHTHLHKNRTGVTSCIEQIIPAIKAKYDVILIGSLISEAKRFSLISGLRCAFNYIKQGHSVIWHVHRNNELLIAITFRVFMAKTKIIATRHSAKKPSLFSKFLYARADRVITLNREMHEALGLPSNLIPHGISPDCFKSKELEIENKKQYIGVVGRVRPLKGQIDVVKALIPIFKKNENWDCFIVGKYRQGYYHEIIQLIEEAKLSDRFIFTGEVSNIYPYYNVMDINVITSYTEGSSMVPLEAMLCHTAVVATENIGTNSLLIESGFNGELYASGNIIKLREILLDLTNNVEKIELYKKRAYQNVCENWSSQTEATKIMTIYEEVNKI